MELKNVNFDMLETVKKHCILFAADGNSVIMPYKALYKVEDITGNTEHNPLFLEIVKSKETWGEDRYRLYEDLGKICSFVAWIPGYLTLNVFAEQMQKWEYFGKDGLLKRLKMSEESGLYINKMDIELCILLEEIDLARHYAKYREKYLKTLEEKEKADAEDRERKRREEEEKHQQKISNQIKEAENAIRERKTLLNEPLEETTIILYLLKKHDIKVPLRTQGWINSALAKVWFRDGEITYSYYTSSKNSTVFMRYLKELQVKIDAA